jgi:hypothetical protein
MVSAANGNFEPIAEVSENCCVRLQHEARCRYLEAIATMRRPMPSFQHSAANLYFVRQIGLLQQQKMRMPEKNTRPS